MGIEFINVSHNYNKKSSEGINNINLKINNTNELITICGKTGSGKSTLVQHLNLLLKHTDGLIKIDGSEFKKNTKKRTGYLKGEIGLVFQFPEYQLFEDTVKDDIEFGPKNLYKDTKTAEDNRRYACSLLGLDDSYLSKNPLKLSGGEKRRVAIAGILAMKPKILVLDEPTSGLDPKRQQEMIDLIKDLNDNHNMTIVVVTHSMDLISKISKRVLVMKDGKLSFDGTKEELFSSNMLEKLSLRKPTNIRLIELINKKFNSDIDSNLYSEEELVNIIIEKGL